MNDRVVKNPNFRNNGEFYKSLAARPAGIKDWPNTHTEVEHLGNGKFGASLSLGHRVFFDKADGNKPKKHKLTDERPSKDYVLIQSAKCCVEVYPYYAKYFDVQHEEVRVEEERWVVQRLFKEPDTWRDVDAYNPQIAVEEYPEPAGDVVKVTVTYDTDYGVLTVEYFQRDGSALKHNVSFKNTSDAEETFRVVLRWAGIVADRIDKEEITVPRETHVYDLHFEKGDKVCIHENLSSFIPTWQDECEAAKKMWTRHGECDRCGKCCLNCPHYIKEYPRCAIYETRPDFCKEFPWDPEQIKEIPECTYSFEATEVTAYPKNLYPPKVGLHPQGLKTDFTYGDWNLKSGESLTIDPDTATLDNPTEDGWLNKSGFSVEVCQTSTPVISRSHPSVLWAGGRGDPKDTCAYRLYIEWPISSLARATLTANPFFKYEGADDLADDEEINPITEEAPSGATAVNLWSYIATGIAYVDPFSVVIGANQSQDLGGSAKSDLQTAMNASQSWFAIGIQSPNNECMALESGDFVSDICPENKTEPAANPPPTLYVEYTPPVGLENKSANMAAKMVAAGLI